MRVNRFALLMPIDSNHGGAPLQISRGEREASRAIDREFYGAATTEPSELWL